MLTSKIKYNYTYDFELPITREGRAFLTRSFNSNTIKPMILSQVMGFFYSFFMLPLMRGFLVLQSSVAKTNRQNVIIPFYVASVFKVKTGQLSIGLETVQMGLIILP